MKTKTRLKIADVTIGFKSADPMLAITGAGQHFVSEDRGRNHISVRVKVVPRLPRLGAAKPVFVTCHFEDGEENWRLWKNRGGFLFTCPIKGKEQVITINRGFDRMTAFLLRKPRKGRAWDIEDIIYDFLQVLLIVYLAQRRQGVIFHAAGIRDADGSGLLFAGKSTAGKSTTAKLWHREPGTTVLNDDRVIVRKRRGRFVMYSSPWHGDFHDHVASHIKANRLDDIFFIRHASANAATPVAPAKFIERFYPVTFPAFWDKSCLESILAFGQEIAARVPCFDLGLRKGPDSISYIRRFLKKDRALPAGKR